MNRLSFLAAFSLLCLSNAQAGTSGPAEIPVQQVKEKEAVGPFRLPLQGAMAIQIPQSISGISVGGSHIANVVVHDEHTFILTGRAYGSTNLHIMDTSGNIIVDTEVHVVNASANLVKLNEGGFDHTYSCTPNCEASPSIGDELTWFEDRVNQAALLNPN